MSDVDAEWFPAVAVAARGALCLRSKCGALLVKDGQVIGTGFNGPPGGNLALRCCLTAQPSRAKPKTDRTCCVHAEWRALLDALAERPDDIQGATMVFGRVDAHGGLQRSGKPYCTVCSRLTLERGVASWLLWHEEGIRRYSALEYHRLSERFDSV